MALFLPMPLRDWRSNCKVAGAVVALDGRAPSLLWVIHGRQIKPNCAQSFVRCTPNSRRALLLCSLTQPRCGYRSIGPDAVR
jgi:hypothetical protein